MYIFHVLVCQTDNGLQYISQEILNFAKAYDFKLITRSPYYARATGKA